MSEELIEISVENESNSALRKATNIDPATIAAKAIMCDVFDRSGIKREFEKLDHDTVEHIQFVWQTIIEKAYAKYRR